MRWLIGQIDLTIAAVWVGLLWKVVGLFLVELLLRGRVVVWHTDLGKSAVASRTVVEDGRAGPGGAAVGCKTS